MKKNKKFIWLLKTWHKNMQNHIKLVDRSKFVTANRFRIKIRSILYISSSLEKNYTKVVLKNLEEYFYHGSMVTLEQKLEIQLVAVNRKTKIHIKYFSATLGVNYIFSKYLKQPIHITKPYREAVKKYLDFQ